MFLRKKAQSTAEYAITIGLVIAVAAGIMQQVLKGGMRKKQQQAVKLLMEAGNVTGGLPALTAADKDTLYSQEWRRTNITESDDETTMLKGGLEGKKQIQKAQTDSVSIELLDPNEK